MQKHEIPTPALVVDYDKLVYNITEMAERARQAGKALRPHIKTHKTPIIAQMQMQAGAVGITCAKLGEAEVMAAAGIQDIWVCYPIVGADKIERLLNLARWVPTMACSVDAPEMARAISAAAVARGQRIDVMVEVEAGYRRVGIQAGELFVNFVKEIVASMPGLRYRGVTYMAGGTCKSADPAQQLAGEQAGAKVAIDAAASLRPYGIATEVVSGGSTPGSRYMAHLAGVTEYRPGCYVFGDMAYADLGAHTRQQMALTILATVVSVPAGPEPDHFVVDAGSKTITHFRAPTTPGYGTFVQMPDIHIAVASEEHGGVHLPKGVRPPALGTKLDIWPNYVSDVVNQSDELWVVRGDEVMAVWPISAARKRV
jgi:D-serine deaminase-like pyridoxal phosphate-dependent protein